MDTGGKRAGKEVRKGGMSRKGTVEASATFPGAKVGVSHKIEKRGRGRTHYGSLRRKDTGGRGPRTGTLSRRTKVGRTASLI